MSFSSPSTSKVVPSTCSRHKRKRSPGSTTLAGRGTRTWSIDTDKTEDTEETDIWSTPAKAGQETEQGELRGEQGSSSSSSDLGKALASIELAGKTSGVAVGFAFVSPGSAHRQSSPCPLGKAREAYRRKRNTRQREWCTPLVVFRSFVKHRARRGAKVMRFGSMTGTKIEDESAVSARHTCGVIPGAASGEGACGD